MKTGLEHLPQGKRDELAFVVELLRAGFAEAIAGRRAERFRDGKLLKIILFGSYARDDWVEDPVGRYFSDYDLLVVVSHEDLTDVAEFWLPTEQRLTEEVSSGARLRTLASPIYHSLDDVNEKLALGRYFFIDILRDGILLFEEPGYPFAKPQPLTPQQALKETQDYFEEWFESACEFMDDYEGNLAKGRLKKAAFELHQATERFYHCLFLVRTLYSPKSHNLNRLRSLAEDLEPSLKAVWPTESKFQRRCYELLRAAYVKARYSRHYRITADELAWLGERVAMLQGLVRTACEARIETLARAA
ncbi:HEPN domain-containing protein [Flavisphingomonas formosensis]|uniref:HEPN domain-containing protein n=1 Tax=Flavisphingomonas formosensis TaxID=861534 RepID=UPI0012FC1AE9|nr:HEPN domain-containing protein [Sphingomonas formosensis]